jgi:hypothetical protein
MKFVGGPTIAGVLNGGGPAADKKLKKQTSLCAFLSMVMTLLLVVADDGSYLVMVCRAL